MAVLERFSDREPDYWRYRARPEPRREPDLTPTPAALGANQDPEVVAAWQASRERSRR